MSMRPGEIRVPAGAVDLSALKARAQQPTPPAGGTSADAGPWVIDVVDATFEQDVLLRSREVPVVIDFWAEWCGPCKQLSPVLERLAAQDQGAWILAKIDTEASPRLAQAFQVQSIPAVFAVIAEQPVPLFQGALPEAQVRQVLDQVLAAARQQGLPGGGGETPVAAPALDPAYDEAEQALARGDVDAARAAYQNLVARNPGDTLAQTALTRIDLIARARGYDQQSVRRRAADDPADVAAQCAVADLDLLTGNVDDAFGRLIDLVGRTSGGDRDQTRAHLLSLFEVLDPDDPRLAKARRDLANALF